MKNGGFTLIELIIAVALVGILSSLVTPKVRIQLAKGRDTKAISYLGAMRTAAELYYIEKGEAPTTVISPNEADDKKAIENILPYLDPKAESVIKDGKIQIGGSRKDENGKITIDDVAAGEDIRKIERAQAILQNALQSLRAAQTEGANSKGQTAQAIYDKSQELINQIQRLDNNLEETTNYIRHVLAVYKAKDEMLKAIMASQNMV